jgi:hypothetical protein
VSAALRAFLVLRSGTEVSVTVHRDFESVLTSWLGRPNPAVTGGVLHVGFSRPPSREFESLIEANEGRLLVTASAMHSLPEGYSASEVSLGTIGALPIHLGIRGWGYEVPDDEVPRHSSSRRDVAGERVQPTSWLKEYLEFQPDDAHALQDGGIYDDRTYFEKEARLPWSIRRSLGIHRFKEVVGDPTSDPCRFARAAPPWLLARSFATIDLSVRVANVFTNLEVTRVADLSHLTLDDLLSTKNFGRKSVNDLMASLRTSLNEGPVATPPYNLVYEEFLYSPQSRAISRKSRQFDLEELPDALPNRPEAGTLIEAIQQSLDRFDDRAREIIVRRMGLGHQPETLNELGERFGVTRERIRQVEAKVLRALIKRELWDDQLSAKLSQLIHDRTMPLPVKGIEGADPWFANMGQEAPALVYLLENVSTGQAKVLSIDGTQYIGALTQAEWDEAEQNARGLLESGADLAWTFEHCRAVIRALLPEKCSEFRDLLWEQATRQAYFVEKDGVSVLSGYGRGAENYVLAVLTASSRPLHYSEIPPLVEERYHRHVDVRRAHNAAAEVGHLFGRGIYGLDKHISLPDAVLSQLTDGVQEIVSEGPPGRQWHAAELVAELNERQVEGAMKIDKFLLNIALKRFSTLKDLGRLVWAAPDAQTSESSRIDIRQAIISILHEAGSPLTTAEIRERVSANRGVDTLFQIFPLDPVLRVAPGVWGLNDRDLPIKRPDQPRFLDALSTLLRNRGSGLHYEELENSAALRSWGLSVAAFFSLASTDERMRVSTSRYLYLEEWGGPRRESLGEAVRGVLHGDDARLGIAEIASRVSQRLGRPVDRPIISSLLQASGATYDSEDGKWSLTNQSQSGTELFEDEAVEPTAP